MIFESANPLTSRDRFISRKLRIRVVIGGGFVIAVLLMSWVLSVCFSQDHLQMAVAMIICDGVAFGVAYYFNMIWEKRPIRVECPNCEGIVLSNRPWVCGSCKKANTNGNKYPFVDKCSHCEAEPITFKCPHCKELIFLTDDKDEINYAYSLNSPGEETRADKVKVYQETIEDKEHILKSTGYDITIKRLNKRLKELHDESEASNRSVSERKKDSLNKFFDAKSAVKRAARERKAANAEEYKGNKKAREEADAIVDMWVESELAKGEE